MKYRHIFTHVILPKVTHLPCLKILTLLSHENSISSQQVQDLLHSDATVILQLLKAKGAITVKGDRARPGPGQPVVEDHELFKICRAAHCDCTVLSKDLENLQYADRWQPKKNGNAIIEILRDYYRNLGQPYIFNKTEIVVISNLIKSHGELAVRRFLAWYSQKYSNQSLLLAPTHYLEYLSQDTHA